MGKMGFLLSVIIFLNWAKARAQLRLQPLPDSATKNISIKILPQNFYNMSLSFVCKKEVQLQKITSLPIFIRLGSKNYVDYLEKKPNSIGNKQ